MTKTALMPRLLVGYTELGGGKLKRANRFLKPNFGVLPKLKWRGVRYDEYDGLLCCFRLVVGRSFIENYKKFPGRYIADSDAKGGIPPGIKIAHLPVLLDVLDTGDVVYGVVGVGLVTGTSGWACGW